MVPQRARIQPMRDSLPLKRDVMYVENGKRSWTYTKDSISVITETQIAIQIRFVKPKLYGISTCGCNNNTIFQKELFSRFLPPTYAGYVSLATYMPW